MKEIQFVNLRVFHPSLVWFKDIRKGETRFETLCYYNVVTAIE